MTGLAESVPVQQTTAPTPAQAPAPPQASMSLGCFRLFNFETCLAPGVPIGSVTALVLIGGIALAYWVWKR